MATRQYGYPALLLILLVANDPARTRIHQRAIANAEHADHAGANGQRAVPATCASSTGGCRRGERARLDRLASKREPLNNQSSAPFSVGPPPSQEGSTVCPARQRGRPGAKTEGRNLCVSWPSLPHRQGRWHCC